MSQQQGKWHISVSFTYFIRRRPYCATKIVPRFPARKGVTEKVIPVLCPRAVEAACGWPLTFGYRPPFPTHLTSPPSIVHTALFLICSFLPSCELNCPAYPIEICCTGYRDPRLTHRRCLFALANMNLNLLPLVNKARRVSPVLFLFQYFTLLTGVSQPKFEVHLKVGQTHLNPRIHPPSNHTTARSTTSTTSPSCTAPRT